jgi:hypothetical protein
MMTPPPAAVPVVVVHDSVGAEAAVNHALARNRSLIILYSSALALAGGPEVARSMIPDSGPAALLHVLNCGSDAGCARCAMEVGWSHILIDETAESLEKELLSLPPPETVMIWETSEFMQGRNMVNLEGCDDPSAVLDRVLG